MGAINPKGWFTFNERQGMRITTNLDKVVCVKSDSKGLPSITLVGGTTYNVDDGSLTEVITMLRATA